MPEVDKELYAASCNPPRRAKRPPVPAAVEAVSTPPIVAPSQTRTILPMRPYAPRPTSSVEADPPPAPAKRGRKPGPLSRSAREAQRRLNHSIIEKARRTKINDALATLKQLVPPDYGQTKTKEAEIVHEDEDEDDEDAEYGESSNKQKQKPKTKKEEKEKEFKLEILVRTVTFLQDLLQRVEVLESSTAQSTCQNCRGSAKTSKKRKRSDVHNDAETELDHDREPSRGPKVPRQSDKQPSPPSDVGSSTNPSPPVRPLGNTGGDSARLPSISSWLLDPEIDPQLLPAPSTKPSPLITPYLPSPPSSTHFDPIRTSQMPPVLSLGPIATAAMVSGASSSNKNTVRTPEDENAASLLLQIATSPTFRPISSSAVYSLPDPSNFSLHSDLRSQRREAQHERQAQTPSSILGLNHLGSDRLKY